eukprot:2348911-Pleurochrysis_carterae.AAC.1
MRASAWSGPRSNFLRHHAAHVPPRARSQRNGALKARLCVQGYAQVHGVDYDQTFCATMRPTSLRALAAIANSAGM